jgi:choline dehydrogenase
MLEFDFIVAGGGPAGCVLASRLTEDPGVRVLLLEAGPRDWHPFIHIPAGYAMLRPGALTWGYSTVPQRELNGRRLLYPQGRVLGGGSSINAMIYTRGNRADYDGWAQIGCTDWSFDEVLPFFKKSERNIRLVGRYHGTSGPQYVSDPINLHPITRSMVQAAQQRGLAFTSDFNGERQEGVGYHQTTTFRGRRASAATCYLRPALHRPNLVVETHATVERILFVGRKATSVQYRRKGLASTVRASREILVTAGAIGSAKLMMTSGVGPADHLRDLGVEVVQPLAGVGCNLQEHLNIPVVATCSGPYSYYGASQPFRQALWSLQYLLYENGPLTTTVGEAGGFISTDPSQDRPDVQVHLMAAPVMPHGLERLAAYGVTLASNVLRPLSRGTVRLQSADTGVPPLINPNFLAEPDDLHRGVAGVEWTRELLSAPALAPLIRKEIAPGPRVSTKAELAAYVRQVGKMDYHPVGTCKMGVDDMAVVDQKLRVHGLEGLRICDSSIMPTQISGNTAAPTTMIAERAAEFIKAGE